MDAWIAVGGPQPPGSAGPGGWDWWSLVGAATVFVVVQTSQRRLPIAFGLFLAAIGGLILGGLTDAWGVAPVWGTLLLVVLARNLLRGSRAPEV